LARRAQGERLRAASPSKTNKARMPSVDIVLPTSPATIPAPPVHWSTSPEQSVATPADAVQEDEDGPPPITSTEAVVFRGMRFRGHAVPVVSDEDVAAFMNDTSVAIGVSPCAFRLADGGEGSDDNGDVGTGQKLLDLLRRWDVENVALCVTRDDSQSLVSSDVLGAKRFKLSLDCAKIVLEACYDDAAPVLRSREVDGGTGQYFDVVNRSGIPPSRDKPRRATPSIFTTPRKTSIVKDEREPPPQLDMTRRNEIRALREPHGDVELVFRCACALVDGPRWLKPKAAPKTGGPASGWVETWVDVRLALGEHDVQSRLDAVDDVDHEAQDAVRDALVKAGLGPRATDRLRARNEVASEFLPWLWDRIAEDPRGTYQSLAAATSPGRRGSSELLVGRTLAVPPDARQWTRVGGRTQLAMDTVDRTSEFLC